MTFSPKLVLLLGLLWFLAVAALAQEPRPSAGEVIKINTDLVVLDAQILRTKDGAVVSSLKRENFSALT